MSTTEKTLPEEVLEQLDQYENDLQYVWDMLQIHGTAIDSETLRKVLLNLGLVRRGLHDLLSEYNRNQQGVLDTHPTIAQEEDPDLDYRVSPPVRAYPPREVTEIERLSWSM